MLILTRADGEALRLGDDIVIQVISTDGNTVRIGITAPREVVVLRGELVEARQAAEPNHASVVPSPTEPPAETPRRGRLRLRRRPRDSQPA